MVEEIKVGPFVSSCGISLSDPLQHHEYKSTISALQELNKQAKLTAYRLRQLDTMVEETSKENIPSDLLDVIAALTRATTVSQLLHLMLALTICIIAGWRSLSNNFTSKTSTD